MQIDKIIKREVISLIVSIVLILLIFIGVSFASFFVIKEGLANTVSFGDISLKLCRNVSCSDEVTEYGQVIGLEDDGQGNSVPTRIYPYATTAEALQTEPYVFNMNNDGNYKLYVNAFLQEDEDFALANSLFNNTNYSYIGMNSNMVSGTHDFGGYNNAVSSSLTSMDYSRYIKIGVLDCTSGIPENRENSTQVYSFANLIDDKIIENVELDVDSNKTFCLWTWLDENTPNSIQNSYFVAKISLEGAYQPFVNNLREQIITDSNNTTCAGTVCPDTGINFSLPSGSSNGEGLLRLTNANNQEKGKDVYYFRGNVDNNYVLYNGSCYRIIRTNENGGVKIMYYGTSGDGETCNSIIDDTITSQYNATDNDNMYVGYKYGVKEGLVYEKKSVVSRYTPYNNGNISLVKPSNPEFFFMPLTGVGSQIVDVSPYLFYYSPSYTILPNGQFELSSVGRINGYWGSNISVSSTTIEDYNSICNIGTCVVNNYYTCFNTDASATCDTLYQVIDYYNKDTAIVNKIIYASISHDKATTNTNNSTILSSMISSEDPGVSWYDSKLPNDTSVDTFLFCNDRTVGTGGIVDGVEYREPGGLGRYYDVQYTQIISADEQNDLVDQMYKASGGYGKYYTLYAAARRLMTNGSNGTTLGSTNSSPTFKCITPNDELSINNSLTKSIGLLTADEAVYAGASYNQETTSFIKTNKSYWTMTPSRFTYEVDGEENIEKAKVFVIGSDGKLLDTSVTDLDTYFYPVISLNSSVSASSGNGTANTPYIIE